MPTDRLGRSPRRTPRPSDARRLAVACIAFGALASFGAAFSCGEDEPRSQGDPAPRPIPFEERIPYGAPPVDYESDAADDAGARLARKLADGSVRFAWHEGRGWLPSLLEALEVPVSSQSLVFSKTALNPHLVGPKNPRAVYFSDDAYVGWVPGAAALEIATVDPVKGALFYVLPQDAEQPPRLRREARCLACHAGETTLHVPGHVVRGFVTDESGKPLSGWSRITHEQPYARRFGGWYVTGTHAGWTHAGNLFGSGTVERAKLEPGLRANLTDLSPLTDLSRYPSPHSDLVAQLVLHHQVHAQNLVARVAYEHRFGLRSDADERLARYLLFVDEPLLPGPVQGTTSFAEDFASRGPRDVQGRSLRTLDLRTRLLRHRLSWIVQTHAVRAWPGELRERVFARLWTVLHSEAAPHSADERTAIVEIVRATEPRIPIAWRRP